MDNRTTSAYLDDGVEELPTFKPHSLFRRIVVQWLGEARRLEISMDLVITATLIGNIREKYA